MRHKHCHVLSSLAGEHLAGEHSVQGVANGAGGPCRRQLPAWTRKQREASEDGTEGLGYASHCWAFKYLAGEHGVHGAADGAGGRERRTKGALRDGGVAVQVPDGARAVLRQRRGHSLEEVSRKRSLHRSEST